jgi:hypothetical protein
MEILWAALGICAVVVFVFFVLAQHWQRLLRHQAWTIRRLTDRVRILEQVEDPEFRRRINEAASSPLEQVFIFTLRLTERFWNETLHMTKENRDFIKAFGSFLGSVKIEQWRGHSVATITEVRTEGKIPAWQTRSLDCYFDEDAGSNELTLWEVPLSRTNDSAEHPPSLELALIDKSLELCAHAFPSAEGKDPSEPSDEDKIVFFRIPLDVAHLAEFRSQDPLSATDGNGTGETSKLSTNRNSWRTFYIHQDEDIGFEWQLWVRDLAKKAEWDRWKILEPVTSPLAEGTQKRRKRVKVQLSTGWSNW